MAHCVFFVASFWFAIALAAICPSEWQQFGESCYHLVDGKMNWFEANRTCFEKGATLALPVSSEEQDFIWKMFLHISPAVGLWIGCNDVEIEGKWQSCPLKNEGNGYENWNNNQPDNYTDGEDCVMARIGWNGEWNDALCDKKRHAICKFPVNAAANPAHCLRISPDGRFTSRCPVSSHVTKELPGTVVTWCSKGCRSKSQCRSFSLIKQYGGETICRLNSVILQGIADPDVSSLRQDCLFLRSAVMTK